MAKPIVLVIQGEDQTGDLITRIKRDLGELGDEGQRASDKQSDAEKRLRKAVEDRIRAFEAFGRTINTQSVTAVRAYESEAGAMREWARTVDLTEKEHLRLDAALLKVDRRADRTQNKLEGATQAGVRGLADLARGGDNAAQGLQGLIGAAESVAWTFGVEGPIIAGVFAVGAAIVGLVAENKRQIEEQRKAAEDSVRSIEDYVKRLGPAVSRRRLAGAEAELSTAEAIVASLKEQIAAAPVGREGAGMRSMLQSRLDAAKSNLTVMQREVSTLTLQIADAERHAKDEADRKSKQDEEQRGKQMLEERKRRAKQEAEELHRIVMQRTEELEREFFQNPIRPPAPLRIALRELEVGDSIEQLAPLVERTTDAVYSMSAALALFRTGMAATSAEAVKSMGEIEKLGFATQRALQGAAMAGVDSLIRGHESTAKILKRMAAEPIVAEMKMQAISHLKKAGGSAADLNFAGAAAHAAAAAGYVAGAHLIARLGGIGGGGEGAGSGGGAGAQRESTRLGAGGFGGLRGETQRFEFIVVRQDEDGRQISRTRQKIERQNDRNAPTRLVI